MPRDIEVSVEFCCPKCSGEFFNSDVPAQTYHCKGNDRRRCSFTFPWADMWRYSKQVTRVAFETPEEYERASRGESVC